MNSWLLNLRSLGVFFAVILMHGSWPAAHAETLVAYTGEWIPYNYLEGKEVKGVSTEILRAACSEASVDCDIRLVPWVRAYKTVQSTHNALLYTVARKPEREGDFQWVGPILPRATYVYARANLESKPTTAQDLSKLRVGVVRGEASITDLERAGVANEAIVVLPFNVDVLRMMARGMIDAMVDTEIGMHWNLLNNGLSPATVTRVMPLSDVGGYYFAMNRGSDPELVRRLQAGVDRLQRAGRIEAIVRNYRSEH